MGLLFVIIGALIAGWKGAFIALILYLLLK